MRKDMGTLRFSVGFGLCQWAFAAYAPPLHSARYSTFPLTTPFACSLKEAGGAGAEPPQKVTDCRQSSGAGFAVEWSRRQRAGLYPVPRCRRRNGTAKIQPVKGLRVEILHQQNTIRPLTGWIGVVVILHLLIHFT